MKTQPIRPLDFSDAVWLAETEKKAFFSKAWKLDDYCNVMSWGCQAFVLGKIGDPRAVIFLDPVTYKGRVEIFSVFTDPRHWRKGYGEALMERAIEWCEARKFHMVGLMVHDKNPAAVHLYEKMGFRTLRRYPNYYGKKRGAIMMRKELYP